LTAPKVPVVPVLNELPSDLDGHDDELRQMRR
jgi:hypothetical protein